MSAPVMSAHLLVRLARPGAPAAQQAARRVPRPQMRLYLDLQRRQRAPNRRACGGGGVRCGAECRGGGVGARRMRRFRAAFGAQIRGCTSHSQYDAIKGAPCVHLRCAMGGRMSSTTALAMKVARRSFFWGGVGGMGDGGGV